MNRIPLEVRFQRLEDGERSDPACTDSIIQNMANTHIAAYLCGFGDELDWLINALDISAQQIETLTYQDIAVCISKHADKALTSKAIRILSLPFYHRYKERVV